MVIEIVRGLGLGGSESLLVARLESEYKLGTFRTSQVINTYSAGNYFSPQVAAAGVEVVDLGTSSRWLSAYRLWKCAGDLPHGEPVVVHSPWPAAVLKVRRALGLKSNPVVEVAHSTRYALPMLMLGRVLNRFANQCVAVSEEVAASSSTRGFSVVNVVLAGVSRDAMREWVTSHPDAPMRFRARLGLPASARLVVSVGNLLPLKRHRLLLDAVPGLDPDVHVVIVGAGPEEAALRSRAADLGVSDRVHLLGREADAWRWVAVADVVAHPSSREGLPIALVEARVLNLPVAAFAVGGVRTVLGDDGVSVLLAVGQEARFAVEIARLLDQTPGAQAVFSERASASTTWDVVRFSEDFYGRVIDG